MKYSIQSVFHSTLLASVGLVVALGLAGCAGGHANGAGAASAASAASSLAASTANLKDEQGVFVGPTSGKSFDPALAAWQSRTLHAIGRDEEYCLFNYVSVDGAVYMGLDYSKFDLTETELATTGDILAQHSDSLRTGMTRDGLWLMPVTSSNSGESPSALWVSE